MVSIIVCMSHTAYKIAISWWHCQRQLKKNKVKKIFDRTIINILEMVSGCKPEKNSYVTADAKRA